MYRFVDSSEMADWQAYDLLEPIGTRADRALMATLVAAFVNANLDHKKHKPVSPDDFMPGVDPTPQQDRMLGQQALLSAAGMTAVERHGR